MRHEPGGIADLQPDPELTGAVLAGGRSLRMGHPKERLRIQGETLLWRQLRILREAGAGPRWISTGRAAGAEPGPAPAPVPDGVRWVQDAESGLGPLAGLSAVLESAETPWTLVLAVDLPAMTPDFLRRLLSRRQGQTGAVPHLAGRYEPLAAVYPRAIAACLRRRLQERNLRLQSMVQEAIDSGHVCRFEVPPGDHALFANWNRPEDLPPDIAVSD